jgi:hypothetical protein
MPYQNNLIHYKNYKLLIFSFLISIITYGFALTNFTVTIDNETPIYSDFGMEFGRWGQNLILYHLFNGHLHYFTLITSLFIYSIAAVGLTRIFKIQETTSYIFCALFITFPQISYQVAFSMMADIAAIGVLLSVFCVYFFMKGTNANNKKNKLLYYLCVVLILTFSISIYQAFVLIPPTIYFLLFFKNTFKENFNLKTEIKSIVTLSLLLIISLILYIISVKIICPPISSNGYLSSFITGGSDNQFSAFCLIWYNNLIGQFYVGETTFILVPIVSLLLIAHFIITKKLIFIRVVAIFLILLLPFLTSFFITNGYHPPRIYVTSNIVYAFIIAFAIDYFKVFNYNLTKIGVVIIATINFYYVTKLFYTSNQIFKHDVRIAEKIDDLIISKYPDFPLSEKKVFFSGYFPYEYHNNIRLDKSEIFGGSFYSWDNGNNYRIVNFFKVASIADYTILNSKEELNKVKDSIAKMPAWPNSNSIKMIDNIIVVKLGDSKGMPMYFE